MHAFPKLMVGLYGEQHLNKWTDALLVGLCTQQVLKIKP